MDFDYARAEILTPEGLGKRLGLSRRWVIIHSRPDAVDPIPHLKLGRVPRYAWGSPELSAWLQRRQR